MPNRLAQESSPYLLQHANNPVDWYTWGEEALYKAKTEDKPIFLSIGYSACHWCHVMEHESFENEKTAQIMNELYVNIKVDREERPDLDTIYMKAVMALTGHGGWPMSVFLTPDGVPFYGGTYYPPSSRYGMPSFEQVLKSISHAYHNQKEDITSNANTILNHIQATMSLDSQNWLDSSVIEQAVQSLAHNFDHKNGGNTGSPKFPQPMAYDFLLRAYQRDPQANILEMVEITLQKMAQGGIYDQLGGGFHRYSVDAVWLVPHFEKMLYDNALLARLYLHAYQLTGKPFYRQIVEQTLDYVTREMTDPAGGFYSTQDADSEGVEGKFFLWTPAAVLDLLGEEDGQIFCEVYDVRPSGNFEGESILHLTHPISEMAEKLDMPLEQLQEMLERGRSTLFIARENRIKPARDEKIITAWNGLMLAAFAEAGRVLNRPDYINTAIQNAEFTLATMQREGRLFRTWKADAGEAKLMGYLEDYAFYADGLLALYQTCFDPQWFNWARGLMDTVLTHFSDEADGGFFDTADDHEQLVTRPKNLQDNATPSGNSMAIRNLLLLAAFTGEHTYHEVATKALAALQGPLSQHPGAFAHWLGAFEFATTAPKEIALVGELDDPTIQAMLETLQKPYRPNQIVAVASASDADDHPELLHDRPAQGGIATAYVCENFTCQQPVATVSELEGLT
ncbi:thioredoxin domain-containing protein [Anaerolineales bacterium HSG6]|nr:thioredoxin domain-containing protein [Anaerolineales bacterium HSG6]